MKIQTENGQNYLETAQRMLFFYNRPREKRACITCSDDFVLYIGTAEGTCIRNSADFRLQEEQKDCTIIRRYSDGELSVIVTYTAEGNIFVKRIEIVSGTPLDLKKVCLLSGRSSLPLSRGGEGQPIFFGDMFWGGIEYPVANNTYEDGVYTVEADWLGQVLGSVNMDDYESLQYFQTQLADLGVLDKLVALGVKEGDTVRIGEYEFDYLF